MSRLPLILLTLLCLTLPAAAQITSLRDPLPPAAESALDEARSVAAEALEVYGSYHPDQPLFRKAISLGRKAVQLAPENPETLRFLAELYGVTDFYGPAFRLWQRYLEADGTLDKNAAQQYARTGNAFGYARYAQGDLGGAISAYRAVAAQAPQNLRAQRWSGRILFEQDKPRASLPYWQRVLELKPGDEGATYFLELAQAGARYGVAAAEAFYEGVVAFEGQAHNVARQKFRQAVRLNPDYAAAWGYLGRVAFEAGNFDRAAQAYGRASALEPRNQNFRYFLEQARKK